MRRMVLVMLAMLIASSFSHLPTGDDLDGRNAMDGVGGREALTFSPDVSYRFIQNSQNIALNQLKDINDIYHFVGIHAYTDGVSAINATLRGELIVRLQSYQNRDGGFGDWESDRSKAGSTRLAVETLAMLGAQPLNLTSLELFVAELQVTGLQYGNYGFRSTIRESDADISTTYDAVRTLSMLQLTVPNATGVEEYVHQHRNLDGGYGFQTNREAGIFWTSTTIHTERALLTLDELGAIPDQPSLTEDFLRTTQAAGGGFANTPGGVAKVSYTWDAILAFDSLAVALPRANDAADFLESNQVADGGWLEYGLDTETGLHSTHFAVRALTMLGRAYGHTPILGFLDAELSGGVNGGFGNQPGMDSNIRITFDAVSSLNSIGRNPNNHTAAAEFLLSAQNLDGGFGFGGSSVESTYRSVAALHRLGVDVPNSSATIDYLRSAQNLDGGFGFTAGRPSTAAYTYRAVMALNLLASSAVDEAGAADYLQNLQNSDGGFGNQAGDGTSAIGSTYRCIRGLATLSSQPLNVDGAETFILNSQNVDGGFRLSPSSTLSPNNLSTAVRTYDAVIALEHLGRPLASTTAVDGFIKSLRNPDLGYAEKPDFTSEVDDTFISLTALLSLHPELDTPPIILESGVSNSTPLSNQEVWFNLTYNDTDGQRADKVVLEINGIPQLMPLSKSLPAISRYNTTMPVGNHTYRFLIQSGEDVVTSQSGQVDVSPVGSPPAIDISVSPQEGDVETVFTFHANYSDVDGDAAKFVRLSINGGEWIEMADDGGGDGGFQYITTLPPGRHTARTRTSDGVNIVLSDNLQAPFVHSPDTSRPDWATFIKIEALVLSERGVQIGIDDVSLTIHEGVQAWVVVTPDELLFVTLDGSELIVEEESDAFIPTEISERFDGRILLAGASIIATILLLFGLKGRLRKGRRRKDLDPWMTSEDYWED